MTVSVRILYLWWLGAGCSMHGETMPVQNFDAVPPLINHAFSEVMRCNPAEHPVLVTEAAWNTPANRERMAEIMFEEFQVPAFYIANTGVLNASVCSLLLYLRCF